MGGKADRRAGARPEPVGCPGQQPVSEDSKRLLVLQQELAQLKHTPSVQLLARQRIPRLEEAIKRLMPA